MAAYRRVDDLTVTCRLTACRPGSAPGPMLGVEYGKPLPFLDRQLRAESRCCCCQIIKDRVTEHVVRSTFTWNTAPGSLMLLPEFSQSLDKFPFYWRHLGVGTDTSSSSLFTAVVYISSRSSFTSASPLHRLMRALSKSSKLDKVFCLLIFIPV